MQQYDTIINGITAIRPEVRLRSWNDSTHVWSTYVVPPVTWKAPPPNVVKRYDPEPRLTKFRYDPSKGRHFKTLRNSGVILVSPLHNVNIVEQDFLAGADHRFKGHGFQQSSGPYYGAPTCFDFIDTSPYLDCLWTEQGDISHWSIKYRDKYFVKNEIVGSDIQDAIAITQQEAMADALTGYDLLSELGELKETLSFLLGSIGQFAGLVSKLRNMDPKVWKLGKDSNPQRLLRSSDKSLRELGSRWMEYRYAVMPIVYSIRDIIKASEGDLVWKTSRAKRVLKPSLRFSDIPSMLTNQAYLYEDLTGEVTVRSYVKQHYAITGLANLLGARLTLNPFVTAWELTRLSFVVDWFINLGNLITLSSCPNFSDQSVLVSSIRDQTVKTVYLFDKSSDVQVSSWPANTCVGAASYTETFTRNVNQPLRTTITDSYNRWIPTEVDSRLIFDVNLNWKRVIDALVLSYQPTKLILRSLK